MDTVSDRKETEEDDQDPNETRPERALKVINRRQRQARKLAPEMHFKTHYKGATSILMQTFREGQATEIIKQTLHGTTNIDP